MKKLSYETTVCLLTAIDVLIDNYRENQEVYRSLHKNYAEVDALLQQVISIEREIKKALAAKKELIETAFEES